MNADNVAWCHDCDVAAPLIGEFFWHANRGHCVGPARCPDDCQFRP